MAQAMKGLKVRPRYEQLINVAVPDGLEHIKFPNHDAAFLRNGFVLSQLDGEGMRAMELQQLRHKEVYMDSALKPLASDPDNDSVSNCPYKSAHAQNTQTERSNEMITASVKPRKEMLKLSTAIYLEMIWNPHSIQMKIHHQDSSSDGQNDMRNHIHIEDYLNSVRDSQCQEKWKLKEGCKRPVKIIR